MIQFRPHVQLKILIPPLVAASVFAFGAKGVLAQSEISPSGLYVPLIGITSVPDPLALPKGPGTVTYHYAVKNFIQEIPLSDVQVFDNSCAPVTFTGGDDNGNGQLDFSETWRYTCSTEVSTTTQSVATATGMTNDITATHQAYATVVVGAPTIPPLVSIVNITKVAYPLSLPAGGGSVTFTYRVNNPGTVSLSDVTVTDDKCAGMSGELGDRNGNGLLDPNEVWVYTCTTNLTQTTTNTATVVAYANGLKAVDYYTLTIPVANSTPSSSPGLPETGTNLGAAMSAWGAWEVLAAVFAVLAVVCGVLWIRSSRMGHRKHRSSR